MVMSVSDLHDEIIIWREYLASERIQQINKEEVK